MDQNMMFGCYEKCRVLIKALGCDEMNGCDKDALLWILEKSFDDLGEAIREVCKK